MEENLAAYYFHQGTNFSAYNYLGCNRIASDKGFSYSFRTWAPSADSVSLVADFIGWNNEIPMSKITENGIYELIIERDKSLEGALYKFKIIKDGVAHLKGDPYATYSKGGDDGASIIFTDRDYKWTDSVWLKRRKKTVVSKKDSFYPYPLNIYEVHLGSFMRKEDNSYLSYREIADFLPSYVKSMGYTHVEFLPLAEHPFDGSWGYQVCAFYAPSSRFGSPTDFKYMINAFHKAGIGAIMDWVPAHFPKDEWGLYEYDGTPLYEYQGKDRQESRSWGTRFFDLGREEIQSFLISNALYFLREYHIDGLRVDAVASMLYLDYDRAPGEWIPNLYGGRENLESIAFFKKLNTTIFSEFDDILMIAEESDSYGGLTHPVYLGGLGFNLKWNMGWANDLYDYLMTDPIYRKYKHKALNFPLMYAFKENYVLPISHDEVVHGKKSFVDKMFGSYEDKFRQMRASLLLMMTYPGKKLCFMGTEYAQFREWDYDNSLEWFMLDYPNHRAMREYVAALNSFYLSRPELYEIDFLERGFKWIHADEAEKNTVAYRRRSISGKELIVIINLSGSEQSYRIPTKKYDKLKLKFASDYLGVEEVKIHKNSSEYYAEINLPPYSGVVYSEEKKSKKYRI